MIQELPNRHPPLIPFRFRRYFEAQNRRIRVFGQCEVTGKNFEVLIPTEEFFIYTQGFKNLDEALKSLSRKSAHSFQREYPLKRRKSSKRPLGLLTLTLPLVDAILSRRRLMREGNHACQECLHKALLYSNL